MKDCMNLRLKTEKQKNQYETNFNDLNLLFLPGDQFRVCILAHLWSHVYLILVCLSLLFGLPFPMKTDRHWI